VTKGQAVVLNGGHTVLGTETISGMSANTRWRAFPDERERALSRRCCRVYQQHRRLG